MCIVHIVFDLCLLKNRPLVSGKALLKGREGIQHNYQQFHFRVNPTHPYSQEIVFSTQVEQNHQVHRDANRILPHSNTVELYAKLYLSLCLVVLDLEQLLHISSETQCWLAWNRISVENTKHIEVYAVLYSYRFWTHQNKFLLEKNRFEIPVSNRKTLTLKCSITICNSKWNCVGNSHAFIPFLKYYNNLWW